jgi:hypothetical protein
MEEDGFDMYDSPIGNMVSTSEGQNLQDIPLSQPLASRMS